MIKHTLGPWSISKNYSTIIVADTKEGQYLICQSDWSNRLTDEEVKANAQLIASAPELLEACKDFKLWYMTLSHLNPDSFIRLKEILPNEIINKFEEAIIKAEG